MDRVMKNVEAKSTDVEVQAMGDGVFVVMQRDEYGKAHSVALNTEAIRGLWSRLAAEG
jgi:hypothetical protein